MLLHKRLFMDLGAMLPLYLHAPGVVLKAEGVDSHSRKTARARRASESLPALRRVVTAEATRRLGSPISLDLFAAAGNTLVLGRAVGLLPRIAHPALGPWWHRGPGPDSSCQCWFKPVGLPHASVSRPSVRQVQVGQPGHAGRNGSGLSRSQSPSVLTVSGRL